MTHVPPKQPPGAIAAARNQEMQNEKRFQEIEQYLVLLLDAAEKLDGIPGTHKQPIRDAKEHLQKRNHRPRPPK
jgi:hypothetical protein